MAAWARRKRQFRPQMLFRHGGLAPLDEVSAHHRHHMGDTGFADGFDLIGMPLVKGIVFRHDTADFHPFSPPFPRISLAFFAFLYYYKFV